MRPSALWTAAAALSFLALAAIVVRLAWISDDAYITLRTVENWCNGHGLRWNVADRVQTYTHPLWMLLLAAGRALNGTSYAPTLLLCFGFSLAAALLLMRQARTPAAATAVAVLLLTSRSFTDYATSGLENPLVFALIALLAAVAAGDLAPPRRVLLLALLTGLALTTRMDLALLFAPPLLSALRHVPPAAAAWRLAVGLAPFLCWEAFALLYYGSPFPITAHAKAFDTGIPFAEMLGQGLWYVAFVGLHDPLTLAVILAGTGLGLARPALRCRALAAGALLYCAYVIKIGGDFMGGRFATPSFVAAVAILARWFAPQPQHRLLLPIAAASVLLVLPGLPAWFRGPAADTRPPDGFHGIVDERRFYYSELGLFAPTRMVPAPGSISAQLRAALGRERPVVWFHGQVGASGFRAGDLVHIVDAWLCDPLLMRLPSGEPEWRIGHIVRIPPTGYLESLAFGQNRIHHEGLRRWFAAQQVVLRAPVFDRERLATMWRMWRGDYDGDLAAFVAEEYFDPPRIAVDAAELAQPLPPGAYWFDHERARVIYHGGLDVRFPAEVTAGRLQLMLNDDNDYVFTFRRGGSAVGRAVVDTAGSAAAGLLPYTAEVPAAAGAFDSIWIDMAGLPSDRVNAIGGLVPVP